MLDCIVSVFTCVYCNVVYHLIIYICDRPPLEGCAGSPQSLLSYTVHAYFIVFTYHEGPLLLRNFSLHTQAQQLRYSAG